MNVHDASTSFCYFCGARGVAGGTCQSCAILLPDPRLPEAPVAATACPRCTGSTLSQLTLPMSQGTIEGAATCARCHGVFVSARSWCSLVAQPELATALEIPARASAAAELVGLLACPACRAQMERGRFAASSDVVVDVCVRHGMWLDAGELADVLKHASARSRGAPAVAMGQAIAEGQLLRGHTQTRAELQGAAGGDSKGRGRMFLVAGAVLVVVLVSVFGGLAAFGAFGVVKEQVKDVPRAAASASGAFN